MPDNNPVENQNNALDLKSTINRFEGHSHYYFGRGTCKKVEQKAKNKLQEQVLIRQKQLEEIFKIIEDFLNILGKEKTEDKLEKFESIFRLMSITRKDWTTHKQLSSEINKIALQEPEIGKVLSNLQEKVYLFDEHVNVKQLLEHSLFMKS